MNINNINKGINDWIKTVNENIKKEGKRHE